MALITISYFAERHGVKRQTIYKAIKEKRLKKIKIVGGVMFIDSRTKWTGRPNGNGR